MDSSSSSLWTSVEDSSSSSSSSSTTSEDSETVREQGDRPGANPMEDEVANATLGLLLRRFPQFDAESVAPAHWLAHGPAPRLAAAALAAATLSCVATAYLAQGLWVYIFRRYRSLRTPTNKLVLSLVAADCLMMTKSWILVINGFAGGPLLGTAGCYVFACLGTCAGLSQIWTIMIISLERVNAIFNPMSKTKRFGHVQVTRWVTCVWAASAFFSVAPLLGWNRYVSEAYFLGCSFDTWSSSPGDRLYVWTLVVLAYAVPLSVIVASYSAICAATRRARQGVIDSRGRRTDGGQWTVSHGTRDAAGNCCCCVPLCRSDDDEQQRDSSTESNGGDHANVTRTSSSGNNGGSSAAGDKANYASEFMKKTLKTERRLAHMVLLIVGVWLATWTPYAAIACLQLTGFGDATPPALSLSALMGAKVSAVLNTFIYGLRLPTFRRRLRVLLLRLPFSPPEWVVRVVGVSDDRGGGGGGTGAGQVNGGGGANGAQKWSFQNGGGGGMASGAGALRMNGYNNNASNCGAGAMAAAENRRLANGRTGRSAAVLTRQPTTFGGGTCVTSTVVVQAPIVEAAAAAAPTASPLPLSRHYSLLTKVNTAKQRAEAARGSKTLPKAIPRKEDRKSPLPAPLASQDDGVATSGNNKLSPSVSESNSESNNNVRLILVRRALEEETAMLAEWRKIIEHKEKKKSSKTRGSAESGSLPKKPTNNKKSRDEAAALRRLTREMEDELRADLAEMASGFSISEDAGGGGGAWKTEKKVVEKEEKEAS